MSADDAKSVVRPEYGPSLAVLLRPRTARWPRAVRIAAATVAIAAAILVLWKLTVGASDGRTHVVIREPLTFNLFHSGGLDRLAPAGGEILSLHTPPSASVEQSFVVRPLHLGEYRGDVNANLALRAAAMIEEMRRTIPGFIWRGDGRIAVNRQPGHQISFQAQIDGEKVYGRRVLLVSGPEPPPSEGLDIMMFVESSAIAPGPDAVGANGQLKSAYRTLRFGTKTKTE